MKLIDFRISYFASLLVRQESDSLFGISRAGEQDIKQIKKGVKRMQILWMNSVQNPFQNTAGSHYLSWLLPAAATRRKFMGLGKWYMAKALVSFMKSLWQGLIIIPLQ